MNILGSNQISNLKLGSSQINRIYLGESSVFSKSSLLLHFDDSFFNSAENGVTISSFGPVSISSDQKRFGSGSCLFGVQGGLDPYGYLTISNTNNLLSLGSEDFTIELWVYLTEPPPTGGCLSLFSGQEDHTFGVMLVQNNGLLLTKMYASSDGVSWDIISDNQGLGSTDISLNAWHHIAWVRKDNTFSLYLDGNLESTQISSGSIVPSNIRLGIWGNNTFFISNGYIDDFRIVKGLAIYNSAFDPPPFPLSVYATLALVKLSSLLLHFDGNFDDSSPRNLIVTPYNDAAISTTTKKWGSGALSLASGYAVTNEGVIPSLSSGDWTVEFWVYPQTMGGPYCLVNLAADGTHQGLNIYYNDGGSEGVAANNGFASDASGGVLVSGVWQHVAVVMKSGVKTIYIDGLVVGTGSQVPATGPYQVRVGNLRGIGWNSDWIIDDLRFIKGLAVYQNEFTPPSGPLSSIVQRVS